MMKHPSGLWLCSLLAFLSITSAVTVGPLNSDTCDIQAWVRAPDLDPGEVIPGQVKIQSKGLCNSITEYSLVLRFKERIWAKIPKPGVILPEKPKLDSHHRYNNMSIAERRVDRNSVLGAGFRPIFSYRNSSWDEFSQKMEDPTLWTIAEEERVAFEARYKLSDGLTPQSEIQSTHDFALLVPTTNYPPANEHSLSFNGEPQAERGNEHIYIYTVEVKFDNGTIIEVPAGYSSFNTVGSNTLNNETLEIGSFTANFTEMDRRRLDCPETPVNNISFNIDITFPRGRRLEQGPSFFQYCMTSSIPLRVHDDLGSTLNFTLTQIGQPQGVPDTDQANQAVILRSPSVDLLLESNQRGVQMLFPELSVPAEIWSSSYARCQYSPTSNDTERAQLCGYLRNRFWNEAPEADWNTTTSVSLEIPKMFLPSFDMYYQSIEAKIRIMLSLKYVRNQNLLLLNDENYAWIPTIVETSQVPYSKHFRTFIKEIPITIHPRIRKPDFQVTHYLSPDARQPVFIDPCTAGKLSRLSVDKRDLLAPRSDPVIIKGTDENIVRIRYNHQKTLYYVGDTWQRKVLDKGLKVNLGENSRCGLFTHEEAQAGFMV